MLIGFPATRLRTVYLALATFAFAEGAQWVFNAWDKVTGGPDGLRIGAPSVLGYRDRHRSDRVPRDGRRSSR